MKRVIGLITCNYASTSMEIANGVRPIASMPFLGRYRLVDFSLSNMVNSGISTVGVIMPFNYRSLIDHLGSGKDWNLDRKSGGLFILPGSAFGTSHTGARFLLRDLISNRPYLERTDAEYVLLSTSNFVFNSDLNELLDQHLESDADITMMTYTTRYNDRDVVGVELDKERVVKTHNGVQRGDEASLDCFIIRRDLLIDMLDWYSATDYLDLFEALHADYNRVKVCTFHFEGHVASIFSKNAYYHANMELLNPMPANELFTPERSIKTKAHDNAPAKFEIGSKVSNSTISAGCRIRGTVTGSILGRNVIIERGAVVRDSVVMEGCIVKEGSVVEHAIVDRSNIIPPGTELRGTSEEILIQRKNNKRVA